MAFFGGMIDLMAIQKKGGSLMHVLNMKKSAWAALLAVVVAMACGAVSLWGVQPALADDYQAGQASLATQSTAPAISAPATATLAVSESKTVTVTDGIAGQSGTWSVTSSKPAVATVTPASKVVTASNGVSTQSNAPATLAVTITGKKAGTATITVKFTTIKGYASEKSIKVTVKGAKKNATKKIGAVTYKVTDNSKTPGKVTVKTAKTTKKSLTIPASVTINNKKYTVTGIAAKALKNCTKTKTLTVKSKSLTKSSVKNSLKSSKVTTVKVPKAKLKAYKTYFTKANCGKKVTVKKY